MQIAEDLFAEYNRLEGIIADIRGTWRGDASQMFGRKLEAYRTALGRDAERLRKDAIRFQKKINKIIMIDQQLAADMAAAVAGR